MNTDARVDLLAPPDDAAVRQALRYFARAIRDAYGDRVKGIYLFGSRARGDHTPDSDADVVVVLADGKWSYWAEKMRLAGMEYDAIIQTGAEPQAWPVRESEWLNPSIHRNPRLIQAMQRDARPIELGS